MHQFYFCGDLASADLVFCWGFSVKCVRKQISILKSLRLRMFRNSLVLFVCVTVSKQNHISATCEGDWQICSPISIKRRG